MSESSDHGACRAARQQHAKSILRSNLQQGIAIIAVLAAPSMVGTPEELSSADTIEERVARIKELLGNSSPPVGAQDSTKLAWSDWKRFSDWVDWGNMKRLD